MNDFPCWRRRSRQATEPALAVASTSATAKTPDMRAMRLPRRLMVKMKLRGEGVLARWSRPCRVTFRRRRCWFMDMPTISQGVGHWRGELRTFLSFMAASVPETRQGVNHVRQWTIEPAPEMSFKIALHAPPYLGASELGYPNLGPGRRTWGCRTGRVRRPEPAADPCSA
jgi:hypothetical protein